MNRYGITTVVIVALVVTSAIGLTVIHDNQPGGAGTAQASESIQVNDLSVDGDEATVNDTIDNFYITVSGTVEWENIDASPEIFLAIEGPDGEMYPIDEIRPAPDGNSADFEMQSGVFSPTPWEVNDFVPEEGETIERELQVRLTVRMVGESGGEDVTEFENVTDTMTITVTNPEDDDGGGGNPGGGGDPGGGDSPDVSIDIMASGSAEIN